MSHIGPAVPKQRWFEDFSLGERFVLWRSLALLCFLAACLPAAAAQEGGASNERPIPAGYGQETVDADAPTVRAIKKFPLPQDGAGFAFLLP